MKLDTIDLGWWKKGLAVFAVVIALGAWLQFATGEGIGAHQAAGTAAEVDRIQNIWGNAGYRWLAIISMIGDLIFIGVYSYGAYRAGRSIIALGSQAIRWLGFAVAIGAVVFLVTDYTETILQVIQLLRDQGIGWMADTAATVRGPKMIAWVVTFAGVIGAIIVRKFGRT